MTSVVDRARGAAYGPAAASALADLWAQAEKITAAGLPDGPETLGLSVTVGVIRACLLRRGEAGISREVLSDLLATTLAPEAMERYRAELRLRLALTYLDPSSDTAALFSAGVGAMAPPAGSRGPEAVRILASPLLREVDLAVGWSSICGPALLRLLAQAFRDLHTAASGKPPIRARPVRLAQQTAVAQLARAQVLRRAEVAELCQVRKRTVNEWVLGRGSVATLGFEVTT